MWYTEKPIKGWTVAADNNLGHRNPDLTLPTCEASGWVDGQELRNRGRGCGAQHAQREESGTHNIDAKE